jgi:hypothetical protein
MQHASTVEPALTPPTNPGSLPEHRTYWPVAVGSLSHIYAAIGAILSTLTMIVLWQRASTAPGPGIAPEVLALASEQREIYIVVIATSAMLLVAALLLGVGAIQLLRRRRVARHILIAWAIAKCALGVINAILLYWNQGLDERMARVTLGPLGPGQSTAAIELVLAALAWMVGPAIFILVWLRRDKIMVETANWP